MQLTDWPFWALVDPEELEVDEYRTEPVVAASQIEPPVEDCHLLEQVVGKSQMETNEVCQHEPIVAAVHLLVRPVGKYRDQKILTRIIRAVFLKNFQHSLLEDSGISIVLVLFSRLLKACSSSPLNTPNSFSNDFNL